MPHLPQVLTVGMVIVAGAAAVYALWKQQSQNPTIADGASSRSGGSSQEDGVVASLAKGVYEAIENFAPDNPDWVIGTGEDWNGDATDPAQNE